VLKPIAIHLPQYYPFKENDEWWGKGFTEWTNVAKAKPLFEGHYQPHIPADLGFYDLRLKESRIAQSKLAKEYGIYGFCYYHYWFNGKRLLNEPIDRMVQSDDTQFPFMLCWANENWTRRWDGQEAEILMKQVYSESDDINHITFLIENFFADKRYIKVEEKPVFIVYRPGDFPDIKKTVEIWRKVAKQNGFDDLFLGYVQGFEFKKDPKSLGFDFAIEYQPDSSNFPPTIQPGIKDKIYHKLGISSSVHYKHSVMEYKDFVKKCLLDASNKPGIYKTVCPMWDNSPRRKTNSTIFHNSTPEVYQLWLDHAAAVTLKSDNKEKFLFINAWNEWAEGNHLEPCLKFGKKYLEATLETVIKYA
jgi:lipopolysaccharide biosynthesis protein